MQKYLVTYIFILIKPTPSIANTTSGQSCKLQAKAKSFSGYAISDMSRKILNWAEKIRIYMAYFNFLLHGNKGTHSFVSWSGEWLRAGRKSYKYHIF